MSLMQVAGLLYILLGSLPSCYIFLVKFVDRFAKLEVFPLCDILLHMFCLPFSMCSDMLFIVFSLLHCKLFSSLFLSPDLKTTFLYYLCLSYSEKANGWKVMKWNLLACICSFASAYFISFPYFLLLCDSILYLF